MTHAYLERLDEVATTMERRWGIDRLPLLVDPELRLRFDRQREKLNQAVAADNPDIIKIQAEGMARAWQALDNAATAAGVAPMTTHCRSAAEISAAELYRRVHALLRRPNSPAGRSAARPPTASGG